MKTDPKPKRRRQPERAARPALSAEGRNDAEKPGPRPRGDDALRTHPGRTRRSPRSGATTEGGGTATRRATRAPRRGCTEGARRVETPTGPRDAGEWKPPQRTWPWIGALRVAWAGRRGSGCERRRPRDSGAVSHLDSSDGATDGARKTAPSETGVALRGVAPSARRLRADGVRRVAPDPVRPAARPDPGGRYRRARDTPKALLSGPAGPRHLLLLVPGQRRLHQRRRASGPGACGRPTSRHQSARARRRPRPRPPPVSTRCPASCRPTSCANVGVGNGISNCFCGAANATTSTGLRRPRQLHGADGGRSARTSLRRKESTASDTLPAPRSKPPASLAPSRPRAPGRAWRTPS